MGLFNFWKKKPALPQQKTKKVSTMGRGPLRTYKATCELIYNDQPLSTIEVKATARSRGIAARKIENDLRIRVAKIHRS